MKIPKSFSILAVLHLAQPETTVFKRLFVQEKSAPHNAASPR
jgi:hypothetical protein